MTLLILGALSCQEDDRQLREMQVKLDSVSDELRHQKELSDSLKNILEKEVEADGFSIFYGKEFEDIEDPEKFLKAELRKHSEKIPLDPVLGGTMEFRQIQILSEDWLLAVYDDGHVQGKTIYEYKLHPNGEVVFSPVVSRLPQ